MHLILISLPPIYACVPCTHPNPPSRSHTPPSGHSPTGRLHPPTASPPHHGGGRGGHHGGSGRGKGKGKGKGGGGGKGHHDHSPPMQPPPATQPTCPIGGLKLGACVDVLGGLVHVGIGNPVENVCCPVIKGLLEIEAAVCLCTSIRLKLLNINIFIPLALQALITCGKTPPPGFVCPPL
ncbi:36.4 kDa proline-rich protein [Linum grandiflorum]